MTNSDRPAAGSAAKFGALGGKARARKLSAEERRAIAVAAAEARWSKMKADPAVEVLEATHTGQLVIGDIAIPCAVLEDGTRLITQRGIYGAIGRSPKTGSMNRQTHAHQLPRFLAPANLKPFISGDLERASSPILFKPSGHRGLSYGYRAEILPEIVNVYLDAREADALKDNQKDIAQRCKILARGLQRVGIIALIDEATGYQEERARDELHRILAAYIAKELLPWTRRFPDEFYHEMFRLWGWQYPPRTGQNKGAPRATRHVGKLTKQLVYEKLPPVVLAELERKNPPNSRWQRRHRHHQWLTDDIGHPHLEKHIAQVIALMRASPNRAVFKRLFARAFPARQGELPLDDRVDAADFD